MTAPDKQRTEAQTTFSDFLLEVGIDVAKKNLQVYADGKQHCIANDRSAIRTLLRQFVRKHKIIRVTCEATGGYEDTLIRTCLDMKVPVSLANPLHVKNFVRSFGTRAKTDKIDACMISRFGRERNPSIISLHWPVIHKLRELQRRMNRLIRHRASLTAEIDKYSSASIRREIRQDINQVSKRIERYVRAIDELVESDEQLHEKRTIMEGVKGVGRSTSTAMLALMPELGSVNRKRIASLAGVAPHPYDSGTMTGVRTVSGGRRGARNALYMAALPAVRHNEVLRKQFQQLRARGKSGKAALIAIARKLLIHLNSLLKPTFSTI